MKKARVIHYFDVEDVFFGNKYDVHGIPKWIAEILTEENVIGTFNITGRKIEALVRDDRKDVINALKKHELGNHTMNGSFQPAMPEYLSNTGWDDGIDAVEKNDGKCFDLIEDVFEKEAYHYHEHFDCISAQAFSAFLKRKKAISSFMAHVYDSYPEHGVAWYCGNLSFAIDLSCNFPANYFSDEWENDFHCWEDNFRKYASKYDFFSVFGCHPFELRSTIFTDRFCSVNGKNLADNEFGLWGTPEVRSDEEMKLAQKNYRKAVQVLARQSCAEVSSFKEVVKIYGYQKKFITKDDLEPFCNDVMNKWEVAIGRYFSPAELLVALCQLIVHYKDTGKFPATIQRIPVLGPVEIPVGWPEIPELESNLLYSLSEQTIMHIHNAGHLPSNLTDGKRNIGPSHLLRGLCSNYLDILSGKLPSRVKMWQAGKKGYDQKIMPLWPLQKVKLWKQHFLRSPEFNPFNLYKFQRLMNWTLKPADTLDHFQNRNIEIEDNPFS